MSDISNPLPPTTFSSQYTWPRWQIITLGALGCIFSLISGLVPLVWAGIAGMALLFWCFMSPVKGLVLVITLSTLFVRSTEDITIQEIVYAVLLGAVLMGWIFQRMAYGQPFTQTATDRYLMWFIAICIISIVPAYFYGNDLIKWLRELVPFLLFLPYFLMVTCVKRTAEIRWFCLAFVLFCITMGVINLIEYWLNIRNAQYLWELASGRQAPGEPIFFSTLTITLIITSFEGLKGWRLPGYLGLIAFSATALAISFSRGYWVATIVALSIAVVLMPREKRRKVLWYVSGMAAVTGLCIAFFMGQLVLDVLTVMGERFQTILSTSLDLSLRNRLVESEAVFEKIVENPIWGYGFGYYYSFFPLISVEVPTWYVHNVYLYLWLKLGLLGMLTYLIFYSTVIVHGYRAYKNTTDSFLKPLVLGITSIMIAMLPLSITSPQFIQKDSILFLALGMGIIELAYRNSLIPQTQKE